MSYRNMPGKLDKRISLTREYQVDDGHNGVVSTFREFAQAWAHVIVGTGKENYQFKRVFAEGQLIFVIRNRSDIEIKESDVVAFGGESLNIRHITKISDKEMYIAIETDKGNGV